MTSFAGSIRRLLVAVALFLTFLTVTFLRDWYWPDMVLFRLPNPVRLGLFFVLTLMATIMIAWLASAAVKAYRDRGIHVT